MTEDVPPARQCDLPGCTTEAIDPMCSPKICAEHLETTEPEGDSRDANPTFETGKTGSTTPETPDTVNSWFDVDFSAIEPDTYPPALLEREQWMGRLAGEKLPFAPWGDKNHPDGDDDKDARYKWGIEDHYVDGDTVAIAEDDDRLDGRVFIQRESDPFGFVDGDDVRCPETGAVHPAFIAILEQLGLTYADVSTSGAGIHAPYTGEIPIDGKGQATFDIDTEPWGANDSPPTVEIYGNKHVCVTTGDHVKGTPLEVTEWDHDALRAILQANGYADKEQITHDTDRDRPDLEEHDPKATGADDTADDVRDVLLAVDRLAPRDLPLQSRQSGVDSTGWETWNPSYRSSESGESVHRPPDESVFHDHKEGESFGLLGLFAAEQGIIRNPWDRLEGGEWWDAVDTAREKGAPIPEYDAPDRGDSDPVAILPPAVRDLTTVTSGWDWRHTAEQGTHTLSIDDARDRTTDAITDAYNRGDRVLIEALPTMGKSHGSIKAAARAGEQITVLTGRGNKEQYGQYKKWCEQYGLSYYQLPSFTRDCDTANGEHGEEWADTVRDWYSRGATPKEIHKNAEYVLGRPLPCQEHDGARCPYASKWDFDPDEFDVLIGHYSHAYKTKVTAGRTVVFDEFPDAYETELGYQLQGAVSYWLKTTDAIPFDDYTDLIENRDDDEKRAKALNWFIDRDLGADETHVFDDGKAHAAAPLAVFTLLASDDLENGFELADLEDVGTGAYNRERGVVSILRPPSLDYASGVVALDGTPTKELWELSLGERLNHRPVLQGEEKTEYVRDALNLNIVRTTEYVKSYNSADHVNTENDAALLKRIAEEHGERPSLITTMTAKGEYDAEGVLEDVDDTKHYGDVLGSNEFKEKRLGAVIGSNHYGDDYIKKWGAYAGRTVERGDGKGADLSYGSFGDRILTHMRDHDTLQAVMRFGRDGNGAVVYVHTNTLPEWVPIAGEGRVVRTRSDGEKQVLKATEDVETWSTTEIAEHPDVDVGRRQVFNILTRFAEQGLLNREYDGRGYTWRDDGLHEVNEHGDVELDPVDLEDVDETTVQEIGRNSIYTWDFLKTRGDGDTTGATPSTHTDQSGSVPVEGDDGPPDPGD